MLGIVITDNARSECYVEVTLDTTLIYQSATLPLISKNGRTYRFNVGDLDILQVRLFQYYC